MRSGPYPTLGYSDCAIFCSAQGPPLPLPGKCVPILFQYSMLSAENYSNIDLLSPEDTVKLIGINFLFTNICFASFPLWDSTLTSEN